MAAKAEKQPSKPRRRRRGVKHSMKKYTFQVCPGNNSRAVLHVFRCRPWWQTMGTNHAPRQQKADKPRGGSRGAKSTPRKQPCLVWEMYRNPKRYRPRTSDGRVQADACCLNHLEKDVELVTKHRLYWNIKSRGEEATTAMLPEYIPETFHLQGCGPGDSSLTAPQRSEWDGFIASFRRHAAHALARDEQAGASVGTTLPPIANCALAHRPEDAGKASKRRKATKAPVMSNVWIVKPAALSNRGAGIQVVTSVEQVTQILSGSKKRNRSGYIVQKYIEDPLLVHGRKFDIRCYLLLVADPTTGHLKSYVYDEGYIRTSSTAYSLSKDSRENKLIHLTNDGIQKDGGGYGKYEDGNKMSYAQFDAYIADRYPEKADWLQREMKPYIERVLSETVACTKAKLNPNFRRNCFQLFGCDFMVDQQFRLKLIEVNSNPCLEFSSKYLEEFIPRLLEDTIQLSVDAFFPPPKSTSTKAASEARGRLSHRRQQNAFREVPAL